MVLMHRRVQKQVEKELSSPGIEPETFCFQDRCFATEPYRHPVVWGTGLTFCSLRSGYRFESHPADIVIEPNMVRGRLHAKYEPTPKPQR